MEIQQALNDFLTTILTLGLGLLAGVIALYVEKLKVKIKEETAKIRDEQTRALVDNAIDRLDKLIDDNVQFAQVTLVDQIKKGAVDGYDIQDLKDVKQVVVENIYAQLTDESKKLIETEIRDLDLYVNNKIEVVLGRIKGQL